MIKNTIPVARKFDTIFHQVVKPFIHGQRGSYREADLISPADLFHLILKCKPQFDSFKVAPSKISGESARGSAVTHEPSMGMDLWRNRWLASVRKKVYERKKEEATSCRLGIRYSISRFPAFETETPNCGLPVGKGDGLYWIRPLSVEAMHTGQENSPVPIELRFFFKMIFSDGTRGQAGYIDAIKPSGRFRRIHVYSDGKKESAEINPELRYIHDLFRTIMGQVLLGEIYPQFYDRIRCDIRQMDPVDENAAFQDNASQSTKFEISADNVVQFFDTKFKQKETEQLPQEAISVPKRIVL